jgi:hypothetical protein
MQHMISSERILLDRMMECSEKQISEVARYGDLHQKELASRVLESAYNFRHWENSHSHLLRRIVSEKSTRRQVLEVKRMALSMIHRKAPFEYLRDKRISGAARHDFFREMYGHHDFATVVVNEHRNYIAAGASYICVERFCSQSSMKEIAVYERCYTGYWRAQTARRLTAGFPGEEASPPELINMLRTDMMQRRERLLSTAPRADALTMDELLRPTGDTVRLKHSPSQLAALLAQDRR